MKVVTAIDSFKGSLTSIEAGEAVAQGMHRVDPSIDMVVRPLADGGEGTVDALVKGMGGSREQVVVTGPFGQPVECEYGAIGETSMASIREISTDDAIWNTKTAVIEMSGAAGITLVSRNELNPLDATTYGVGQVIRDAIGKGCRRFIVGIGGSATNDGGVGMLQALGFDFLDKNGEQIEFGAKGLAELVCIDDGNVIPELSECTFRIACDVTNPLCGVNGCSAVFGPQKGATPDMVSDMDAWLGRYAQLAALKYPKADANYPGTGAAGGMGFAFLTFMNSSLESGIKIVLEETKLEEYLKDADLVVTGEGMLDFQTSMGKAPVGVAQLAKKYGKPVIAFAGGVTEDASACHDKGIDAYFPIVRGVTSLDEAMKPENAKKNLADAAEEVMRLMRLRKVFNFRKR